MFDKLTNRFTYVRASLKLARASGRHDESAVESSAAEMRRADPDDKLSLYMLAATKEQVGKPHDAFRIRQQILAIDPDDFEALRGVANYLAEQGEIELACKAIGRALAVYKPFTDADFPRFGRTIVRVIGRVTGKDDAEAKLNRSLRDIKRSRKRWVAWAKRYLAIHDDARDENEVVN